MEARALVDWAGHNVVSDHRAVSIWRGVAAEAHIVRAGLHTASWQLMDSCLGSTLACRNALVCGSSFAYADNT